MRNRRVNEGITVVGVDGVVAVVRDRTEAIDVGGGPVDNAMKFVQQRYEPEFPIADLHPDPVNPWSGADDAVGESIDAAGFYGAVLVQAGTNRLIAGHTRRRQAIERGARTLPAIVVDVDDETARRMLLVDNRANQRGRFDDQPLLDVLNMLQASDQGLVGTGFNDYDLTDAMNRLSPPSLDELQETYGDPVESHIWPLVHIRLPPDYYSRFRELLEKAEGDTDTARFMAIIDHVSGM